MQPLERRLQRTLFSYVPNIIEIQNATVYRGSNRVFDGLTLTIPKACNTAILGPNGAGKSTLLKLLSRELYPVPRDGSFVRLYGRERWDVWQLRSHLGIVSNDLQQTYAAHAMGIDVILSGYYSSIGKWKHQRFSAAQRERAEEVVLDLELAHLKDRHYASMSTGEQRRFLLGRALVNDPDTLVMDEPTSGLDLKACFQYLDTIRRLMDAGKTVVLVTHHIHEIPPEIARVVLLNHGRVIADGDKSEILTDQRLSGLFATPIHLLYRNGYYQAVPAS